MVDPHYFLALRETFFRTVIMLILIFSVSAGCSGVRQKVFHDIKSNGCFAVQKLEKDLSEESVRQKFAQIAENLQCEQLQILGLYNREFAEEMVSSASFKRGSEMDTTCIYEGESTWGGAFSVINKKNGLLIWMFEPRHVDVKIPGFRDLKKVSAWYIRLIDTYSVYFYETGNTEKGVTFRKKVEKYAGVFINNFSCVNIFIFENQGECRQFASRNNRILLLKNAAITPVEKREYFNPQFTEYGLLHYKLMRKGTAVRGEWRSGRPGKSG